MSSSKPQNVLVIGGAGYIGSVLVRRLLDAGHTVRVLDALLYDNHRAIVDLEENPRFEFHRGDFCDFEVVRRILPGVESVVLLASLVGDPICKRHPKMAVRINYEGTIKLFDGLNRKGLERFIFMSTCSNYGLRKTEAEAIEESELNPKSLYAETKVGVEKHILGSLDRVDFHPVILRAATAYGLSPRMRFDLTVNEFTRELAVGNELLVYDADTWRPYCHVDDISGAILSVLDAPGESISGHVFNVGSQGENYTKRMLVDILTANMPESRVNFREGSVDPRNYRVSFEKITSRLQFTSSRSVEETITTLIEAIRGGQFRDFTAVNPFYGNRLAGE